MTQNFANEEVRQMVETQIALDKEKRDKRNRYLMYGGVALAGLFTFICMRKVSESNRLMRMAVSRVNAMTSIDVPHAVIDAAVVDSANEQVSKIVERSVKSVQGSIEQAARNSVKEAVKDQYGLISGAVTKAIKNEVIKISAEDIASEVREAAKEELVEKLEDKFDDVIENVADGYTRNLDNIGKIYESMAKRMTNTSLT